MVGLFMAGAAMPPPERPAATRQQDMGARTQIRELQHQIGRLTLINQALWELLREKLGLADADLEQRIYEVDLRDGVEDGRMTETALRCPSCDRVSSSKHWRCLYCGQEFEKPLMG